MATISTPIQLDRPEAKPGIDQTIPSLRFDNRTDFDALHFDTIDQHGSTFHVIVAKTGYTLGSCDAQGDALLRPLDAPAQLNLEDRHHDDDPACSVRQESDLAPFKPLCDVIVNAAAYAPQGCAARRFHVALRVQGPDRPGPLPERPRQLNPTHSLAPHVYEAWQAELVKARLVRLDGPVHINKILTVTGERQLRKRLWPVRLLQSGVRLCSLGLINPNPWRLTRPQAALQLPLRYEFAQGGQCRVDAGDAAAGRVPKKYRLTAEQLTQYPDGVAAPVAHAADARNPLGCGFARRWHLKAARAKQWPAPRIERNAAPYTASQFWQAAKGKTPPESTAPAGMGAIGRTWMSRRALLGNFDEKSTARDQNWAGQFKDFDFRYWNGAPADQQCERLAGDERFTLYNLCPHNAPFARSDKQGNTMVRFTLPHQSLFILASSHDGRIDMLPLTIDTIHIDLEAGQVELTWRRCLAADGDIQEARLMHAIEAAQLERLQATASHDDSALSTDKFSVST